MELSYLSVHLSKAKVSPTKLPGVQGRGTSGAR